MNELENEKRSFKKGLIVGILITLILCGGTFAYVYFKTDLIKDNSKEDTTEKNYSSNKDEKIETSGDKVLDKEKEETKEKDKEEVKESKKEDNKKEEVTSKEVDNKSSKEKTDLYLFVLKGCPHCQKELKFLNEIEDEYNLNVKVYEVSSNINNYNFIEKIAEELDHDANGFPTLIVGDEYIEGYNEAMQEDIIDKISELKNGDIKDVVKKIKSSGASSVTLEEALEGIE